jgi:superfamily II DNA or RNA helicase
MSLEICLNSISDECSMSMTKDLNINISIIKNRPKSFQPIQPKIMSVFDVDDTKAYIPFAYGIGKNLTPLSRDYKKINTPFVGKLRDEQKIVKTEAIELLNKHGSTIISCFPGFGKTMTAIYIASKIKYQTLIIINLLVLKDQWIESINKVCPSATVSFIQPSNKVNNFDSDFLIINAINIPKFGRKSFMSIGNVIVDEVHLIMSEVLSQGLFYVSPKYLLGLSATPYRQDGMDALLKLFFTEHRIIRKLYRQHYVYKIKTNFVPEVEYDRNGKTNWNSVINSVSNDVKRNDIIISIIKKFKDNNFLVLCKRTSQANYIYEKLIESGEHCGLYIETTESFDKSVRILIGTIKKVGVGFDFPKLDALLPAIDLESYFIQYLGRIFRTPDGITPIVFDFLDDNSILKRHYKTREKVYKESGGSITDYKI